MSYSFIRPITINSALCGSANSTNFPLLFSPGSLSYLATTSNGGQVQNASGFDIVFFADLAQTTLLPFEVESYNPATGAIIAWVQVPTLSASINTTIYLAYGNSSISVSQANASSLWSGAGYPIVYHFTSGALGTDSSGNGYALAMHNTPTSGTGQIGGCITFNGTNQYADNSGATQYTLHVNADVTVSFWTNNVGNTSNNSAWAFQNFSSGRVQAHCPFGSSLLWDWGNSSTPGRLGATWPTADNNAWTHVVLVGKADGTFQAIYLNGSLAASTGTGGQPATNYSNLSIGAWPAVSLFLNGSVDEFRLAPSVKSASWVTAEYNNQFSPGTFYTIGGLAHLQTLAASMSTFSGALTRNTGKSLNASMSTFSGALTKGVSKALNASLSTMAGAVTKATNKNINASMATMAGACRKNTTKTLSASTNGFTGGVTKNTAKTLSASMSTMSGSLTKSISKTLSASMATMSGALTKATVKNIHASLATFSAGVTKRTAKTIQAVMNGFAAALVSVYHKFYPTPYARMLLVPADERTLAVPQRQTPMLPLRRKIKDPDSTLDYSVDWTNWLNGDTIQSVVWNVSPGITIVSQGMFENQSRVWLSGGILDRTYTVQCLMTTVGGRTESYSFELHIEQK